MEGHSLVINLCVISVNICKLSSTAPGLIISVTLKHKNSFLTKFLVKTVTFLKTSRQSVA